MTDKEVMQSAMNEHCPACGYYCLGNGGVYCIDKPTKVKTTRACLAQPEPDPVAWISTSPARMINWGSDKPVYGDDWIPLYTAPPNRDLVGLTHEEYEAMAEQCVTNCYFDTLEYAKSIEAKLKEKNT